MADDFAANAATTADLGELTIPLGLDTLFVVLDDTGVASITNDLGVEGPEVFEALALADPLDEGDPRTISLTTPTETSGADNLRAFAAVVITADSDEIQWAVAARSLDSVDRTVDRTRNLVLVAVPILTLLVAALTGWLTGRALAPVDRITREVEEIESTDLSRRVHQPEVDDEVGRLATTMNDMLGRLEAGQQMQARFAGDAAHELRTPLASIAAQLDVDAAHPDTADHATTAWSIRQEVHRMQGLIDNLLATARGVRTFDVATAALVDLDVVASSSLQRASAGATVELNAKGIGAATVRGDEAALTRLVDNLVTNALRHAEASIAVGTGTDDHGCWLSVDDDGNGIAEADRDRVFERLVRLDEARARNAGGAGLGLTLSRDIATEHNGTLTIDDSPLGGARFVLRLPDAG